MIKENVPQELAQPKNTALKSAVTLAAPLKQSFSDLNPIRTRGANISPPPGIDHLLCFEKCRYELQTS